MAAAKPFSEELTPASSSPVSRMLFRKGGGRPVTACWKRIRETEEALAVSSKRVTDFAQRLNSIGKRLIDALADL